MTDLFRVVRRRTVLTHRGRRIVVSLHPGDLLGLRPERTRQQELIPIAAIYDYAVKARVFRERAERKKMKGRK